MTSPEDYTTAQAAEYGVYVANVPIYVGGARAYNPGHPVPVSAVEDHPEWVEQQLVSKAGDAPAPQAPAPVTPQGQDIVIPSK